MNAAKMTLVSTVLAAAFGLALGLMSTPAQAHCPHRGSLDHFHCDGGDGIRYFATLSMGGFAFPEMEVVANSKKNLLTPAFTEGPLLDLDRPDPADLADTWNQVFNTCVELLGQDSVEDFTVGIGQVRISKDGGVRVAFANILFDFGNSALLDPDSPAEVTVQLIGDEFNFFASFLPTLDVDDTVRSYPLNQHAIHGSTLRGINPRKACQPPGGGGFDIIDFDPNDPSELTITAAPAP